LTAKSELRRDLINARQAFVKSQILPWHSDREWPSGLMTIVAKARCVAGYVAVRTEADVMPLLNVIAGTGLAIALPYLANRDAMLEFRLFAKNDTLMLAPFGFRQPEPSAPVEQPDVILTPLVGFDRAMNRLGQGAGHYDRLFARYPDALRIGVAWSVQEVRLIDVDPWDVTLDAVITEKEWIIGTDSRIEP
jgi:5-formyltetrahydrofolate cyclo-ligase